MPCAQLIHCVVDLAHHAGRQVWCAMWTWGGSLGWLHEQGEDNLSQEDDVQRPGVQEGFQRLQRMLCDLGSNAEAEVKS